MNLLFVTLFIVSGIIPGTPIQAPDKPVAPRLLPQIALSTSTEEIIKTKAYTASNKYKVDGDQLWNTIQCENPALNPKLQSGYYRNGVREQSYGLAQIHLPSHPDISLEQATDTDWSLDWMASQFSTGKQKLWTCWRNLYGGRSP